MEYTTDPADGVNVVLAKKFEETLHEKSNCGIDKAQLEFCADLRNFCGTNEDPKLTAEIRSYQETEYNAELLIKRIVFKLGTIPNEASIKERRIEWLTVFISQMETKHASLSALIELYDGLDDDEVINLTVEQIRIEGGHKAALEELQSLTKQ